MPGCGCGLISACCGRGGGHGQELFPLGGAEGGQGIGQGGFPCGVALGGEAFVVGEGVAAVFLPDGRDEAQGLCLAIELAQVVLGGGGGCGCGFGGLGGRAVQEVGIGQQPGGLTNDCQPCCMRSGSAIRCMLHGEDNV